MTSRHIVVNMHVVGTLTSKNDCKQNMQNAGVKDVAFFESSAPVKVHTSVEAD